MVNIGVLISGGGTNLQSLIDNIDMGNIDGEIKIVISNRKNAYGLVRAEKAGIEALYINIKNFQSEEEYNKKIIEEFEKRNIELVVLAGYLKILSKEFVQKYNRRIINIHPSLLPDFGGKGYYGDKVHKAVLESGRKITGATVHFVDEGTDTGEIILQEIVEIKEDDTVESLQSRVLEIEHKLLPKAVKLLCEELGENEGDKMKRALISVYDKKGIVEFATELKNLGWDIISTGGTSKVLKEADIDIIEIEEITKFPEILDGRVKTLNPNIHGGILYKRDNEEHKDTLKRLNINSIDMVVNNLYPFEETLKKEGVSHEEIIENIDIGGPSMIRAAAKNYKDIVVLVDPNDYDIIIEELKNTGVTTLKTRQYLAAKVFQYTAYYDALISNYFNKLESLDFPSTISLSFKNKQELRYGENPHQKAAFYKEAGNLEGTIAGGIQLHGKELSFNNINDSNGALEILKEFDDPTIVAVKHANPCGIGSGENLLEAYEKAYESDKISIFGGIIAANREVDEEVAKRINEIFIEIIMAPSFTKEALSVLKSKKNIRIIEIPNIMKNDYSSYDVKKVLGGMLLQERDTKLLPEELKVVTKRKPIDREMKDLLFAWKAVKGVKSNSVLLVKDKGTIGIGMGQTNRVWAVENAIERAGDKVQGSVLASDGFFPFKDSVEALAKAGVTAIIQPGGSIRDEESIIEADKNNIAMIFTGMRHFKH